MALNPTPSANAQEIYSQIGLLCSAVLIFGSIQGDDAICDYARRLAVIAQDKGLTPPPPRANGECGIELVIFLEKLARLAAECFPEAINEKPY